MSIHSPKARNTAHKIRAAIVARTIMFLIAVLAAPISYIAPTAAATLMPPGEITFFDANGNPLSAGSVYFYVPNTLTPKDTWKDAAQSTLNTNPVLLDSAGRAIIYGSGTYRQIVKDSLGNTIWDQQTADTAPSTGTAWGGTSAGTANAQTVTAPSYVSGSGQLLEFLAGFTNTSALTISVNSGTPVAVEKASPSGPVALTGGEVAAGNLILTSFDGANLQLIGSVSLGTGTFGPLTNIASAATTDLGTVPSHNANVTGTAAITSLGSSANTDFPVYRITFAGAATLTYNATSLVLPTAANIVTAAGDTATAQYRGAGNWTISSYSRSDGTALRLATGGTNGIQGQIPYYSASGIVSLLATGTAGQILATQGAGANPAWVAAGALKGVQSFCYGASGCTTNSCTPSCTFTPDSGTTRGFVIITGGGGGGGGGNGNGTTIGWGGGGGGGATAFAYIASLGSVTVTVGAGGTAGAAAAGNGGAGGQSAFGTVTANGGNFGSGGATASGASGAAQPTTSGGLLTIPGEQGFLSASVGIQAGGGSFFAPPTFSFGAAGTLGNNYGGGGSGGSSASTPGAAGGAGAPGVVLVLEF